MIPQVLRTATVTLKDGTTRVGPWNHGRPVGNWWKDHSLVVASTTRDACVSHIASVVKAEEPHTKTTPRTESGWQILALDDLGDNVTGEPGNEANAPAVAVALQGQATSGKEERVKKIIDWLVKIGYDPSQYEMAIYAGKLYEHGFHSVKMIISVSSKLCLFGALRRRQSVLIRTVAALLSLGRDRHAQQYYSPVKKRERVSRDSVPLQHRR